MTPPGRPFHTSAERRQRGPRQSRSGRNVPKLCGIDTFSTGRFISDSPAATKPHFIMGAQKKTGPPDAPGHHTKHIQQRERTRKTGARDHDRPKH